jgi:hypothetical protein
MKNLDDGIRFPGFLPKKTGFNRTGPVRFEPIFGPVRLIFHKINVIRFGWFFESKPNRTVNTPTYMHYFKNTDQYIVAQTLQTECSNLKSHLELLPRTSPNILSGALALFVSVQDPSEYATK